MNYVPLQSSDITVMNNHICNVTKTQEAKIISISAWIKRDKNCIQARTLLAAVTICSIFVLTFEERETSTQDPFGGGNAGGCSSTLWKYSWLNASNADNLLLGSYVRSFKNRSLPAASNMGTTSDMSWVSQRGNRLLYSRRLDTPGHTSSSGVPKVRKILNSWSISESPGNSARRVNISAKTQPRLQISTDVE